ncbi:MAG: hypothetical protein WC470_01425 [Candidatus Paceibacterota bacterium]
MEDFSSFPIEKPGIKHNFASSQMKAKREDGKEMKLGEKDTSLHNAIWGKRVASSSKQAVEGGTPDANKYRKNLSIIKEHATPEDKKVSEQEKDRLKFYKIKFFKK